MNIGGYRERKTRERRGDSGKTRAGFNSARERRRKRKRVGKKGNGEEGKRKGRG
jgi:hypothetical protein